jgi:hypothetical protein
MNLAPRLPANLLIFIRHNTYTDRQGNALAMPFSSLKHPITLPPNTCFDTISPVISDFRRLILLASLFCNIPKLQ